MILYIVFVLSFFFLISFEIMFPVYIHILVHSDDLNIFFLSSLHMFPLSFVQSAGWSFVRSFIRSFARRLHFTCVCKCVCVCLRVISMCFSSSCTSCYMVEYNHSCKGQISLGIPFLSSWATYSTFQGITVGHLNTLFVHSMHVAEFLEKNIRIIKKICKSINLFDFIRFYLLIQYLLIFTLFYIHFERRLGFGGDEWNFLEKLPFIRGFSLRK